MGKLCQNPLIFLSLFFYQINISFTFYIITLVIQLNL